MDFLLGILIALGGIGLVIFLRLFTTLFHEIGHAIPALLFTKKQVTVYIGSYGDISGTKKIDIGRFRIYFKWNFFDWKIGMCKMEETIQEKWKNVLIIIGGPIASLLISVPLMINLRSLEEQTLLFSISIIFIAAATIDFFVNLMPRSSIRFHDGSVSYSDGFLLYSMFVRQFLSKDYLQLEKDFENKKYEKVIEEGTLLLKEKKEERAIYDIVIEAHEALKNYNEALGVYEDLHQHLKLKDVDYYKIGKLYEGLENYREALNCYNHYYHKNFTDPEVLNDLGHVKLQLGDNEAAIRHFNTAIARAPDFAKPYVNRSGAKINIGQLEEALNDLSIAKLLNDKLPMLYFNLGLIYEKWGRYTESLKNFEQAETFGCTHHGIDFKIGSLRNEVRRSGQ